MHFGKSFEQVLVTLPEEYQERVIDYKKLKKLIRAVVLELQNAGLSPQVLQDLLQAQQSSSKGKERAFGERSSDTNYSKALYELSREAGTIIPHLKVWQPSSSNLSLTSSAYIDEVSVSSGTPTSSLSPTDSPSVDTAALPDQPKSIVRQRQRSGSLLYALHSTRATPEARAADAWGVESDEPSDPALVPLTVPLPESPTDTAPNNTSNATDVVLDIALQADAAFFALLTDTITEIAQLQKRVSDEFMTEVQGLARTVSDAARPTSERGKSDLYAWREIFSLWVETQVFESNNERTRGERPLAEAEDRLGKFAREVTKRGLGDGRTLKRADSRAAVEKFLQLNLDVLNLKKFERLNADAARKILKKHAKRTALPTPALVPGGDATAMVLVLPKSDPASSLAHTLLLALTETLLPVLPSVEDYTCLICTSIAFKPIRLDCSHLFCVRCLVKMQRAGKECCPLCRSPTVLRANKVNLDAALLNFMNDWFPKEVREKSRSNEQEIAIEEIEQKGYTDKGSPCTVQ